MDCDVRNQPNPALTEMMLAEGDEPLFDQRGEMLAPRAPEPQPAPPPPLLIEPAPWAVLHEPSLPTPAPAVPQPFRPPAPDWQREAEERLQRERAERQSDPAAEPENSLQAIPAAKEPKPKKTPRLDRVRRWLEEDQ
jgi:hypothetical protein